MRVRVLTINVQNDEGDPRRRELINADIRRLDPDLVALQEVLGPPSGHLDGLLVGTPLTGTHQSDALGYELPFVDRYGGTALASRWPHRVVEVLDQRGTDAADVPWCTMAALVDVPDCGELLFIGTTGSWRLDAEVTRERQVLAVADLDARHRTAIPTVIAGDLNAEPDAASVRFLTGRQSLQGRSVQYHDAWAVGGDGPGYTWTVDNANGAEQIGAVVRQPNHRRRLDYVLLGSWSAHPRGRAEVADARVVLDEPVDGVWPSDHFGVLVELNVEVEPEPS